MLYIVAFSNDSCYSLLLCMSLPSWSVHIIALIFIGNMAPRTRAARAKTPPPSSRSRGTSVRFAPDWDGILSVFLENCPEVTSLPPSKVKAMAPGPTSSDDAQNAALTFFYENFPLLEDAKEEDWTKPVVQLSSDLWDRLHNKQAIQVPTYSLSALYHH